MDERQVTRNQSMAKMLITWQYMADAADSYTGRRKSVSGLVGGDGLKMRQYACGPRPCPAATSARSSPRRCPWRSPTPACAALWRPLRQAPAACCRRCCCPLCKYEELSQHQLLEAPVRGQWNRGGHRLPGLHCRGGRRLSGGDRHSDRHGGGCPDGSAGRLREQIGHAVAMALKNLMGLICDPVAGLVEVPCVKRNVIGAVNAISAADMAMAGITSRIPVDEVIDAMGEVGRRMPVEFRETALGGLAVTPTGQAITERIRKSK